MSVYERVVIAVTVLTGLTFFAALAFAGLACCWVKPVNEPSRRSLTYIKVAFSLSAIGLIFTTLSHFVSWFATQQVQGSEFTGLWPMSVHLVEVGELFVNLSDAPFVCAVAVLERGIAGPVQPEDKPSRGSKILVSIVRVVGAIMALTWTVSWALALHLNIEVQNVDFTFGDTQDFVAVRQSVRALRMTFWVLAMAVSAALVAHFAGSGARKEPAMDAQTMRALESPKQLSYRTEPGQTTRLLLASVAIYLIRPLYHLQSWARSSWLARNGQTLGYWDPVNDFLRLFLGTWPLLISLVVLIFLKKKHLSGGPSERRKDLEKKSGPNAMLRHVA